MCRGGFNVECVEDGCTNRVTCIYENELCKEHGFESLMVEDD